MSLQAMIGQMKDATSLHDNLTNAWLKFGWLPELFDVSESPFFTHVPLLAISAAVTPLPRREAAQLMCGCVGLWNGRPEQPAPDREGLPAAAGAH